MPLFDKDKIIRLVSELRKSLKRLKDLKELSRENFLNDPDKVGSAKYHFIVAIESCIDICNHIISKNGYRVPEDYADTFKVMGEVGAFNNTCVEDLRNMVKFRNRLVHLYWEVEDSIIYDILQTRLQDFKKFLNSIALFLEFETLAKS